MSVEFTETLEVLNENGATTVRLIPSSATVSAGGAGIIGNLTLGESGVAGPSPIVQISGNGVARFGGTNRPGEISVREAGNDAVFQFTAEDATLTIGAEDHSANVRWVDGTGHDVFLLDAPPLGGQSRLRIGHEGVAVDFELCNRDGETVMRADGYNQTLFAPDLVSRDIASESLALDGVPGGILNIYGVPPSGTGFGTPSIRMEGRGADVRIGREGISGDLEIYDDQGRRMFDFGAEGGRLELGAEGLRGDVLLRASSGKTSVIANGDEGVIGFNSKGIRSYHLRNEFGSLWLGAAKNEGDLVIWDDQGLEALHADGDSGLRVRDKQGLNLFYARRLPAPRVFIGDKGQPGRLLISDSDGNHSIQLDGNSGIFVGGEGIAVLGGDCAEEFDVVDPTRAEPGTVMCIGNDGRLQPCDQSSDSRVAGVRLGRRRHKTGPSNGCAPVPRRERPRADRARRHGHVQGRCPLRRDPSGRSAYDVRNRGTRAARRRSVSVPRVDHRQGVATSGRG